MMTNATATGSGARLRARWTDLAGVGFLLSALGPLILLIAVLAWRLDTEGETAFFGAIIGIGGVGAFLVRRFGAWAKIVGALLALLLMFGLWWTIFGLFAGPTSFFDFMPSLLVLPGALIAFVSCIGAFVAGRRGHTGSGAERGERKAIRVALTVVVLAALVSGPLTFASRSTVGDASTAGATVTMKDFEFFPKELAVAGGSAVFVRNDDPFLHTFTIDALGVDEKITIGSEALITIPSRPGTYVLYCQPHTEDPDDPGTNDMTATLRVT